MGERSPRRPHKPQTPVRSRVPQSLKGPGKLASLPGLLLSLVFVDPVQSMMYEGSDGQD